jgi:hypothetical protein
MNDVKIQNMIEDISGYLGQKKRNPEDVLQALQRLTDYYVEQLPKSKAPKIMGPLSRWILDRFTNRLHEAREKHRALSLKFESLKPLCAAEKVRSTMGDLCREMQRVWEPFKEFVGLCPHCAIPRFPGTTEGSDGFGCPRCGTLEKISVNGKK